MKLYEDPTSGNCYKVKLLLSHLGRPFSTERIDVTSREDRRPLFPKGAPSTRVPLLVLDDGRMLSESNAILLFLARGTSFLPEDPFEQAGVHRWMFFEQNHLEPNIAVARFIVHVIGKADRFPEVVPFLQKRGAETLERMEAQLAQTPVICGDRYTVADIALFGYGHIAGESGIPTNGYPRLAEWVERVRAQPGFVPMFPE